MTTLDNILDFSAGEKFYRFGNADGKYWIMPARSMRTVMNLYQPSGIRGKMVKALLPCMHAIPQVRRIIHAETAHCRLNAELCSLLKEIFNTREIEFGIFEGTPSVHQKITMQLSSGSRILGYCKLSNSDDIKELFAKESEMLSWLAGKGVTGIPKVLYCGTLECGTHIFVQSTAKTASSSAKHNWCRLHNEFLSQLHEKTKESIAFEDSEFCHSLDLLERHISWLPDNIDAELISRAITGIKSSSCGKKVEFSAFHGDFTPWNMFVEKGRLFVFDFEYAAKSYPPGLDRYHFFTQTAVFERKWGADEIASFMKKKEGEWIDSKLYSMYLLDVISRFTMREGGKVSRDAAKPFALWCRLLEKMMK